MELLQEFFLFRVQISWLILKKFPHIFPLTIYRERLRENTIGLDLRLRFFSSSIRKGPQFLTAIQETIELIYEKMRE